MPSSKCNAFVTHLFGGISHRNLETRIVQLIKTCELLGIGIFVSVCAKLDNLRVNIIIKK